MELENNDYPSPNGSGGKQYIYYKEYLFLIIQLILRTVNYIFIYKNIVKAYLFI